MNATFTSLSFRNSARQAEADGNFVVAERDLRQALAADPGDGASVFALAEFLLRRGRYAEAEPHYEKLRTAFPTQPALLNSVAMLLSKTGRTPQAVDMWEKLH